MPKAQKKMNSKIGPVYLVADETGLKGVFWNDQHISKPKNSSAPEAIILDQAEQELDEYFDRKRKWFTVPLDAEGTEFQKRVWKQLEQIPYGETRSYKQIATILKDPNASRAVGTANGKNPICIIVPCHRVIAADGSLGGFSGGLDIKRKLLDLEKPEIN